MFKKLRDTRGFTLVEILVVILIIGILFAAFAPRMDFAGDKARETGVRTDLRTFMVGAEQLFKEQAGLPDRIQEPSPAEPGDANEAVLGDNVTQLNRLLDPSLALVAATETAYDGKGYEADGLVSLLEDPWGENYRVDIYSHYPDENKQAILITSHGREYATDNSTADYGALVVYEAGRVTSCTFGFNGNIGTFENKAEKIEWLAGDTDAEFNIGEFEIENAKCNVN